MGIANAHFVTAIFSHADPPMNRVGNDPKMLATHLSTSACCEIGRENSMPSFPFSNYERATLPPFKSPWFEPIL